MSGNGQGSSGASPPHHPRSITPSALSPPSIHHSPAPSPEQQLRTDNSPSLIADIVTHPPSPERAADRDPGSDRDRQALIISRDRHPMDGFHPPPPSSTTPRLVPLVLATHPLPSRSGEERNQKALLFKNVMCTGSCRVCIRPMGEKKKCPKKKIPRCKQPPRPGCVTSRGMDWIGLDLVCSPALPACRCRPAQRALRETYPISHLSLSHAMPAQPVWTLTCTGQWVVMCMAGYHDVVCMYVCPVQIYVCRAA